MGVTVALAAPAVSVEPGQEASVEARLRNSGGVVDEFSLDVLGDAAAWASVEPPVVSLFPGAEGTARVVFRPPRESTTPTGPIPFGLRARSREDPDGSAVEEGVVDVGWFLEPFVELVPRTSRGSRGASHEVALDNRGNARMSAEVSAADADRLLTFDIDPPAVVVEPGMAGFAKLRVKPAKRFWRGPPKTRPFQLLAQPEGHLPITIDGTFLQESVLPPWFMRALIALALALVGLVLLWFLVLRPSIESAASQAVEAPIGELRDDVNSALGDAGLPTLPPAGGSPDPAPSGEPTPTPTGGGGPPVIPGLGEPVDGRLSAAAPTVDPEGTLFITDLVFANPNGREGAVVLLRNATPLLELRLENFRDLDFHFVTPIVLVPGQTLNLSLACSGDGPCDPTVFYSGYLRP